MTKRSYDSMSDPDEPLSSKDIALQWEAAPGSDIAHVAKATALEPAGTPHPVVMQCRLPPHAASVGFSSLEAFEIHYMQEHTNRCSACGKNLPSAHFLHLHLDEAHNPVREALAAKGEKTFSCLVEDCDKKCSNPSRRRLHLIDKHGFPKLYNFRIIERGIDHTTTLLRDGRRRRVSVDADPPSGHQRRISRAEIAKPENRAVATASVDAEVQDLATVDAGQDRIRRPTTSLGASKEDKRQEAHGSIKELETTFSALNLIPRSVIARQHQKED